MNDKQRKFILLRADGLSFDKIAKELKTSKVTLIKWNKLFIDDIKDLQFESFLKIKEVYSNNNKNKYEILLKQLNKIDTAILEADLSTSNIKDICTIKNHLTLQIEELEKTITFNPNITITNELGYEEQLKFNLYEA